jgi:GH15 family glucan-1,4-alpha-glucosidase
MATKVKDEYRHNELSIQEGGTSLTVYQTDGKVLTYDKVKSVEKYISAILRRSSGKIVRIVNTDTNHQYYPNVEQ